MHMHVMDVLLLNTATGLKDSNRTNSCTMPVKPNTSLHFLNVKKHLVELKLFFFCNLIYVSLLRHLFNNMVVADETYLEKMTSIFDFLAVLQCMAMILWGSLVR